MARRGYRKTDDTATTDAIEETNRKIDRRQRNNRRERRHTKRETTEEIEETDKIR